MAYGGQQSGDIRATLALSRAEAVNGTSRTLNLPGGRQVVVPVPTGINNGQEIRLEGQGQPTNYGGRGLLILTTALAPSESYGSQPFPNPRTDFPTEMMPLPPPPQTISSPNYPSVQQYGVYTTYPAQDQQSINAAQTTPSYGQSPWYPAQQSPQPLQTPFPVAQPQRRRPSPLFIVMLVVLLLLIIGGSGLPSWLCTKSMVC